MLFLGCSKSLHISRSKIFLSTKNRDREPSFLYKHKVEKYFDKWYRESKPISDEDVKKLDSLSFLGYQIYESLMSDSILLKELSVNRKYKYVLVPNTIKISLFQSSNIDSCLNTTSFEESKATTVELIDFRPQIENRKCLYYTEKYRKHFPQFSTKYGVKPYVLIDSPLMLGGNRFLETSPLVDEIKVFKNSNIISIIYSIQTSIFESLFKYENSKLTFMKHRYEMGVD